MRDYIRSIAPRSSVILFPPLVDCVSVEVGDKVVQDIPVVLYSGNLSLQDGVYDLIKACLYQKGSKKWHLHLTGFLNQNDSGSRFLLSEIKKHTSVGLIHYYGYLSYGDLQCLYKRASVFVVTKSPAEANRYCFPGKLVEAVTRYQIPVIAADVGDVALYFKPGFDVVYYRPGDVIGLADVINDLVFNDAYCKTLTHNALKAACKELSCIKWGSILFRYLTKPLPKIRMVKLIKTIKISSLHERTHDEPGSGESTISSPRA